MPSVVVKPPEAELARARELLKPGQFRQAIWQAVSRTTNKGRTQARQVAKDLTGLPAKYVNRAVVSTLTRGEIPVGTVAVTRAPMPLGAYKTSDSKRAGVKSEGTKGMSPLAFRHGFKATMKSGHTGYFLRAKGIAGVLDKSALTFAFVPLSQRVAGGNYSSRIYIELPKGSRKRALAKSNAAGIARRLPIVELMGRPIIDAVNSDAVINAVTVDVQSEMSTQLRSQINRFLKIKTSHGRAN